MLNTRNEDKKTIFYSCLACFVNTFTLNVYMSMSYTGWTRRNTWFIFLWLRHMNTWTPIQHLGFGGTDSVNGRTHTKTHPMLLLIVVSSRPRTTRRAPHIYPDIWGDGVQYHSSQLTFSDEWYCPQSCDPEDVGSTPGLSHSHRRVLTLIIQCYYLLSSSLLIRIAAAVRQRTQSTDELIRKLIQCYYLLLWAAGRVRRAALHTYIPIYEAMDSSTTHHSWPFQTSGTVPSHAAQRTWVRLPVFHIPTAGFWHLSSNATTYSVVAY